MRYGPDAPEQTYVKHAFEELSFDTGEVALNYATAGSSANPAILLIPGLPIIASRVVGVTDAIRDDREGLLFAPGQAEELAQAIASLLHDPARACRLAKEARARCERCFSERGMLDRLQDEIEAAAHAGA